MLTIEIYWFTDGFGFFTYLAVLSSVLVIRAVYRMLTGN